MDGRKPMYQNNSQESSGEEHPVADKIHFMNNIIMS